MNRPVNFSSLSPASVNTTNENAAIKKTSDTSKTRHFFSTLGHYVKVIFRKKTQSYDLIKAQYNLDFPKQSLAVHALKLRENHLDDSLNLSLKSKKDTSVRSVENIQALMRIQTIAAQEVLNTYPMHASKLQALKVELSQKLVNVQNMFSQSGKASQAQLKAALDYKAELEQTLVDAAPIGKDVPKVVKAELRDAIAVQLNQISEHWQPIERRIEWKDKTFISRMLPAAQLPLLEKAYEQSGVVGISSMATSESKHAMNLWISEFQSSDGRTLFKGVRHGVNTPFGITDPATRALGADRRTKEVMIAALESQVDAVKTHLNSDQGDQPFTLRMTSTSLLTPSQFRKGKAYKDRQFIEEQLAAWQRANTGPAMKLDVKIDGVLKTIEVKPKILAFNFGVNAGAKLASKFPNVVKFTDYLPETDITGWKIADKLNEEPLKQLLGWADKFLENCSDRTQQQRIQTYMDNIKTLTLTQQHHKDGNRAYALPEQIVLLSHELGVIPAWNCMSGKDRTGMLDAEVKQALIEQEFRNGRAADFSSAMEGERQELHDKVLLESGNHEIQKANTGVPGYKVLEGGLIAVASNISNIAEMNRDEVKGLSGIVRA